MKKIIFKYKLRHIDEAVEKLNIEEIYNVFYDAPFEVIGTEYGYEYEEVESDELIDVNIVVVSDRDLDETLSRVCSTLSLTDKDIKIENIEETYSYTFDPIDLGNGWTLCDPSYETNLNRIDFVPQGAFGTGEHETTQDCLRYILDRDYTGKSIIDIGTGSGILSIAAGIKGANKITSVDIRDVKDEVEYNASLNNLYNIEVIVGNMLEDRLVNNTYDLTIINIGGEETLMFMDEIVRVTKKGGTLLVSGLFISCFDRVVSTIEENGFKNTDKIINGEWCTAVFSCI